MALLKALINSFLVFRYSCISSLNSTKTGEGSFPELFKICAIFTNWLILLPIWPICKPIIFITCNISGVKIFLGLFLEWSRTSRIYSEKFLMPELSKSDCRTSYWSSLTLKVITLWFPQYLIGIKIGLLPLFYLWL